MVVLSHYANWMYVEPTHPALKEFLGTWGVYGVDIFFLLSGYGLMKSAKRSGVNARFALKRFLSAYLPYILIVGFFVIIEGGLTSGEDVLKLLTGYDYWYMYVLFAFYIIFIVLYNVPKVNLILMTASVAGFSFWLYSQDRADFWILSNAAFLLGIYMAAAENVNEKIFAAKWMRIALPAVGIIGTALFAYLYAANPILSLEMCRSIFFTIAMAGIIINIRGFGVVLCSMGTYSLYIYLMHTRLFWKVVMMHDGWNYVLNCLLAALVTVIICLPLGFALEWLIGLAFKKILPVRREEK